MEQLQATIIRNFTDFTANNAVAVKKDSP